MKGARANEESSCCAAPSSLSAFKDWGFLVQSKSKPPPAEETTGVQVDGARLEIYGDFEAQRQPPRPSNTGYAVLATTKRDRFQAPQRESPPAAAISARTSNSRRLAAPRAAAG